MPLKAKFFIAVTAACGAAVLGTALLHWHSNDLLKFGCYLLIAVLAATMKVQLPGVEGTMSVHFLFVLLGILELSLPETLVIGCTAALVQSVWKAKHPEWVKVVFNVLSMTANAIVLSFFAYQLLAKPLGNSMPLLLVAAACAYFLSNTIPVAIVIALSEQRPLRTIWGETYFWSFPYYLVGAAFAGLMITTSRLAGWQTSFLVMPLMALVYVSYRLHVKKAVLCPSTS